MANGLILNILLVVVCYSPSLFGGALNVVQHGCDHLDMVEVRRLIALELGQTSDHQPAQITLICDEDALRIVVHRDQARQMMERSIELGETHLKERIIALTISQLVITETPPAVERSSAPLPSTPPPVSTSPRQEAVDTVDHVAISIGSGIKPHDWFSLPTGYWAIRSGIWFSPRLGLISLLSFEWGRTPRSLGSVNALCGLAGLGAAFRAWTSRYLNFEMSASASIGYTQLIGKPHQEAGGADVGGVAGEFVVGIAGVAIIKDVLLALDLLGAYTVKNPVGTVEGERSVTLAGFWLGGGLRIGLVKR